MPAYKVLQRSMHPTQCYLLAEGSIIELPEGCEAKGVLELVTPPAPEVSAPAGNPVGEAEATEGTEGEDGDDPTDEELEKIAKAQAKAAKAAATKAANKAKVEAEAAK